MPKVEGGSRSIEDRKTVTCSLYVVASKECIGDHGNPELIVETGANVHHTALGVKGERIAVFVLPEVVGHVKSELAGPIVIDIDVGKGGVKTRVGTHEQCIVEIVRADGKRSRGVVWIDAVAIVDDDTMTSLK